MKEIDNFMARDIHEEAFTCEECNGTGIIPCSECKRYGYDEKCSTCHGTDEEICPECDGRGEWIERW